MVPKNELARSAFSARVSREYPRASLHFSDPSAYLYIELFFQTITTSYTLDSDSLSYSIEYKHH